MSIIISLKRNKIAQIGWLIGGENLLSKRNQFILISGRRGHEGLKFEPHLCPRPLYFVATVTETGRSTKCFKMHRSQCEFSHIFWGQCPDTQFLIWVTGLLPNVTHSCSILKSLPIEMLQTHTLFSI